MNEMNAPGCPQCGAPLPANTPAGLCPRCLMAMNVATQTALPSDPTSLAERAKAKPAPRPEEIAGLFPQLEILECLGRGGMGVVYKARQRSLNRLVALKILAPEREKDAAFAQRFALEAETLAKLDHPNIVAVHDFGEAGGLFYLVMEFVDGLNLHQLIDGHRLAPREALAIVPQICDALQFAHDRGIVHRDIKPENVLLDRRGRVKVADFGLAKMVGAPAGSSAQGAATPEPAAMTQAGKIMGTPQYMAPEQLRRPAEVDHRADIYALGVVLYQMLTGELPDRKLEPPSRKVQIDVRLDEVVLRALEKEPARRYTQASVMKTELETIAADQPSEQTDVLPAAELPAGSAVPLEHALTLCAGALRWLRRLACVLGTIWGVAFLLFVLRNGLPLIDYAPPRVASGIQAAFLGLLLAGLGAGWWRDGLAAALTLSGWTLFFLSEPYPFPHLWLYAPVIIGLMHLWSWLLPAAVKTPIARGQAPLDNAAAELVSRLVAQPARRLMWLGILGLAGTMLFPCRGYGETAVVFGLFIGPTVWRVPVPAGWGPTGFAVGSLLPALCLLVAIAAWNLRRLQNHRVVLAGAVLAMFLPPLFPVSYPLGLWVWWVLTRPEIRLEFSRAGRSRQAALQRTTPRLSRVAVASALVGILPGVLIAAAMAVARDLTQPIIHQSSFAWQIVVGLPLALLGSWSTPLAAIALAWVAWEDLRSSHGRLRGAGLIVFAALSPALGKLFWWLHRDSLVGTQWLASLAANLARTQVVLLVSAGLALWVHWLEANRARSSQQHSSWWLFAPSIRWVIVGMAVFSLLGFRPRAASADRMAKPGVTTNAPSQAAGPQALSVGADRYPMHTAARKGEQQAVTAYIEKGSPVDARNDEGQTPLHLAAAYAHQQLAGFLLEKGAVMDATDKRGRTPLAEAIANSHEGMAAFLADKGADPAFAGRALCGDDATSPRLARSLKIQTLSAFETECKEPGVLLDSPRVCFFAPKRKEAEARIVFPYLVQAYEELHRITGVHTANKVAVYAFPARNPNVTGGTSGPDSVEYDELSLDLAGQEEWTKYRVPHVSGIIEEMAHCFVTATGAKFGWEMLGWSLGVEACSKVANNPKFARDLASTREEQGKTFERYMAAGCRFPDDLPANLCDRIHAWVLYGCERAYGALFWLDFYSQVRLQRDGLFNAIRQGDSASVRNTRCRITIQCFDRLPGLHFSERLKAAGISLSTDVKSLKPEAPGWDRRLGP